MEIAGLYAVNYLRKRVNQNQEKTDSILELAL